MSQERISRLITTYFAAMVALNAAGLEFDVVSVKPSADVGRGGPGPGFSPPTLQMGSGAGGRFVSRGLPLRPVILLAYGVQDYQLSGGPAWITSDRFDIEAKPEAGLNPTEEQSREMLQNMLAMRFGLRIRRETKNGPAYALTLAKGGIKDKLKRSADQTPPDPLADNGMEGPAAGMATLMSLGAMPGPPGGLGPGGPGGGGPGGGGPGGGGPGGGGPGGGFGGGRGPGGPEGGPRGGGPPMEQMMGMSLDEMKRGALLGGPGMLRAKAVPLAEIIRPVMGEIRKPVTDKTGLTGLYDIELNWTPAQMAQMLENLPADAPLPPGMDRNAQTIFKALETQLGLKLDSTTGPIEGIVVEKVEKPSEN